VENSFKLRVEPDGWCTTSLTIEPWMVAATIDVPCEPLWGVRGRVVDESGEGIEGAQVSVNTRGRIEESDLPGEPWIGRWTRETVETDVSGGFVLRTGIPGRRDTLRARKSGYSGASVPWHGEVDGIELILQRGGTVRGVVRWGGVPGEAHVLWTSGRRSGRTACAIDGTFELRGLPLGPVELRATKGSRGLSRADVDIVVEVSLDQIATCEIDKPAGIDPIEGIVRVGDGPAVDLYVLARDQESGHQEATHTNHEGSYSLPVLEGRTYEVFFGRNDNVEGVPAGARLDRVIERRPELRLRVRDSASGHLLSDYHLIAFGADGLSYGPTRMVADETGVATLELDPSLYDLVIVPPNASVVRLPEVRVALGEEGILEVIAPPKNRIVLRVLDASGEPLTGIMVFCRQEDWNRVDGGFGSTALAADWGVGHRWSGLTDDQGRVVLRGLAEEEYDVLTFTEDGESWSMATESIVVGSQGEQSFQLRVDED